MKLNEVTETDADTLERGGTVTYTKKSLAEWMNWYLKDWREYGETSSHLRFSKRTYFLVQPTDIPDKLLRSVNADINELDPNEYSEDTFEEHRMDILIYAMKYLNLSVPE